MGVSPRAKSEAVSAACLSCGASGMEAFYEAENVPAQTCVLLDSAEESLGFPVASVLLAFCSTCGFIQNIRFQASLIDYSKPTEESQAFSPTFKDFADSLADRLVDRHDLVGKTVLEVGCGKGDFLTLLAARGIGRGLGIDPGYLPERQVTTDGEIEFRREWYHAGSTGLTGDLVLTRHLLEHVPNVAEFFGWLHMSARQTPGSVVFTEVPDTARVLREGAFWDVYHEHCSYFTLGSLARSLRQAGLPVSRLETGYDDQYLLATSELAGKDIVFEEEESAGEIGEMARAFGRTAATTISQWRSRIEEVALDGGSVGVWGGGSKAAAFLAAVPAEDVTVVDINPHKQGKWLPGSGALVEDPSVLAERTPQLVIPMNPIYVDEIRHDLHEMGLDPEIEAL